MTITNLQKSFWAMTLSSFFGALIAVSIKALSFHTSISVIFFFTRIFLLLGVIPTFMRYRSTLFEIHNWFGMIIMSVLYVAAFYCYFYSLALVPLAISSLLINSAPLYVPIIAFFVLKDMAIKSKILWLTMLISFAGVILVLSPNGKAHYSFVGFVLAFLSGILLAASQVFTKWVTKNHQPHHIAFFQTIMSIIITFFPAFFIVAHHGVDYLSGLFTFNNTAMLILCGISSWIYQLYRAKAMTFASVSFAMPFGYLGVVFVGILDLIFWDVLPDAISIIGMIVVMIGVILSLKLSKKVAEQSDPLV
ncbi:MAG TPA: DMT family transporter [Coxiellaceae bacterium]|nr:DMT family transporter [Coxiellaceae bacterium]